MGGENLSVNIAYWGGNLLARVDELDQRLASVPRVGRPEKYDADFRARVKSYYEAGHTYKETASYFAISTNTVGRILKE